MVNKYGVIESKLISCRITLLGWPLQSGWMDHFFPSLCSRFHFPFNPKIQVVRAFNEGTLAARAQNIFDQHRTQNDGSHIHRVLKSCIRGDGFAARSRG
jgi:hypothetical protein